ncbi:alpha/beta fold hydrolase [Nocardia sp. NPDC050793]|uniref:alpha/beta fold hydrolase n=1 Tax=Nocardia sp. NPDC050793 TaxID=3155159 RepID=UPI0033F4D819
MPLLRANGVSLAYTDTGTPPGRPDAPTILFGHGLLFGGWMFRPQIDVLRDRYRCVTVDWRGQGETPATAGGYDMDTLCDDAEALIRELDLAPVHFVGLSMGGFVGLRLGARRGRLLRSLTVLDTTADGEPRDAARKYTLFAWIYQLLGAAPLKQQVLPTLFGPDFLNSRRSEPVVHEWSARLSRSSRTGIRKAILAVADHAAIGDELADIVAPTLVIVGADDNATPRLDAERLVARIDGSTVQVVPAAGHTSNLEQPHIVTACLASFLHSVDNELGDLSKATASLDGVGHGTH